MPGCVRLDYGLAIGMISAVLVGSIVGSFFLEVMPYLVIQIMHIVTYSCFLCNHL